MDMTTKQIQACVDNNYCPEGMRMAVTFGDAPAEPERTAAVHSNPQKPIAVPIPVKEGLETYILEHGRKVIQDAMAREQRRCGSSMIPAVYFVTDAEAPEAAAYDVLKDMYQHNYGGNDPISLCPCPDDRDVIPSFGRSGKNPNCSPAGMNTTGIVTVETEDKGPSIMELKDEYLKRVTMFRVEKDCYLYIGQIYQLLSDNALESNILTVLSDSAYKIDTPATVRSVAHAVRIEGRIAVQSIQEPPDRIPLLNGVLNTATVPMRLEAFSPAWPFTWQMNTYWVEDGNACPVFDRFIYETMGGDQSLIDRSWEIMSYALLARGQPAKKFFLFYGPSGNNGKSVLGDVLAAFYDPSMVTSLSMNQMGERFSTASLACSKINISMENSSESLSPRAVGFLKACTGRDRVELSVKYKSDVITSISCPFIFGTNYRLKLQERDDAFENRVLVLPFQYEVPPERRDPALTEKLIRELPGIFFKASHYFQTLRNRGYCFTGEDTVRDILAREQYMGGIISACGPSLEESLEQFLAEHCREDPEGFVPSREILDAYQLYSGCPVNASDTKIFYAKLKEFLEGSYQAVNKKRRVNGAPVSGYEGISLKSM